MKASETNRSRPEPIPIRDKSEARANRSYIIQAPAVKPAKKQEADHGEAV